MKRDDLYALLPSEFTKARNALAKEDPSVRGLRKPSWALWAVNQLGRRHAREVKAMIEAAGALDRTQRRVLKGHASAGDLRAASRTHKEALARLEALAAQALEAEGAGAGPQVIRKVRATLHAASIADDATRLQLATGVIEDELEPPDILAAMTDLGPLPPPRKKARPERDAEEKKRRKAEAAARARAEMQAAKMDARAEKLEHEARELRRKARDLRHADR